MSNSNWEVSDIGFFLLDQRYNLNAATEVNSINKKSLDKYPGIYKVKDSDITFFVSRQDTQLWVRLKGQNNFRVYPKSEKKFYYKVVNAEIEFNIIPDTDSVRGLTLYQNGAQIFAQRVKGNDQLIQKKRKKTIINPAILKRYVGKYQIAPGFIIEVTINDQDQLFIQATGQPKVPIFPESETKFFLKMVDAQIEFINLENRGQSKSIKLYQNGQVLNGKRIF